MARTKSNQGNYQAVTLNAVKHGVLSKRVVLPHEDEAEFSELLEALVNEHQPAGMTEQHLVEELAAVIWRKRRALIAEGAIINRNLARSLSEPFTDLPAATLLAVIEDYVSASMKPASKIQTIGEAVTGRNLQNLARYETHLDRKFERTLGMLLKLQELRGG